MDKIFKAKRLDNGEWVEFSLEQSSRYVFADENTEYSLDIEHLVLNKNTICQYTGIDHKEGNKIFEWDEVEDSDSHKHLFSYCKYDHCVKIGDYSVDAWIIEGLTLTGKNIHDD